MSDWRLTPQNSVLVVVDVQEKLFKLAHRREESLAGMQKLIRACRLLGVPGIVTLQYVKGLGPITPELVEDTKDLPAMEKQAFSCCGLPEFARALKDLRRQRVILCGIEAHVCVQQTAIDLMKDYFVYVCADAVTSRTGMDCVTGIERMRDCGAVITTVESAVFEMLREAGTEGFKKVLPVFK